MPTGRWELGRALDAPRACAEVATGVILSAFPQVTAKAAIVTGLITGLREHGTDAPRACSSSIGGGKALRAAIRSVFGTRSWCSEAVGARNAL